MSRRSPLRRHLYLQFALVLLAACACAGTAGATVTAISSGGSDGSRYPIITGDGADDTITVTCGSDGNVKINGLDPVARFGTPGPVPIACADMTSVGVTGGDGNDTIDLSAVSRDAGFVNPRLCAPCSNNAWAIYSDCEDNGGNDSIISSPIGGLMGGCGGGTPMAGADVVIGGDGREEVTAGPGDDQINLGGGKDSVSGGSGSDRLRGGAGNDSLSGDAGADALNGGPGHDRCDGGPGADTADACEVIRGI